MEGYLFDGPKYITKGVKEELPPVLVRYLWSLIEKRKAVGIPMDYLQVFTISSIMKDNKEAFFVTHSQETPPHRQVYQLNSFVKAYGKIFVIDDVDHVTMMLAHEY